MTVTTMQRLKQVEAQLDKLRSWIRVAELPELIRQCDDMSKAVAAAIKKEA